MRANYEQLESRNRRRMQVNVVLLGLLTVGCLGRLWELSRVNAASNQLPPHLAVSELTVLDEQGVVRARIGGKLPDAVFDGRTHPRGQGAAGVLLHETTGQERGGFVTFDSGHVGLTLDNRVGGQAGEFIAGPANGAVFREHTGSTILEMKADEDGPSLHMLQDKQVVFHEPAIANPQSTKFCKEFK